jgi:UV excision repair protein RAD23
MRSTNNAIKPKAVPAASSSTATPAKAPATPAPAVASTPAPPAAPVAQTGSTNTSNVPATPTPAGSGSTAPSGNSSGLAMGAERAAQIAEMESMGFERSQIDLAMRAAFFNSERAIEYLLTVSEFRDDVQQQS